MILKYADLEIEFDSLADGSLSGRLLLRDEQMNQLKAYLAKEPEDWALDRDGERLPVDQLFALSLWSWKRPGGDEKILNRFINIATGEALFSTRDTYAGTDYLAAGAKHDR